MRYIDVRWIHDNREDPIRSLSEIGEDEFEKRKLEFFVDGSVTFASAGDHSGNTELGTMEIPPLDEINEDREFEGIEISRSDFEGLWLKYSK